MSKICYNIRMKKSILFCCIAFLTTSIFAQEALKSAEEEYYDFLALTGYTQRPSISYRTLSDSVWNIENSEETVWRNNKLNTVFNLWEPDFKYDNFFTNGIDQGLILKLYNPDFYNSYNSAAPYGQNDGALWQGKGYNMALTGGARLEGYGFEVTFKPQISCTLNQSFEYIQPAYSNEGIYEGKAGVFGDYSLGSLDAPQRFGNKPIFTFDWGDSEIRWSWNTFTMGFGTQNIWLGPAQINPIMHSNTAAGYPHFDFGFRKQKIQIKDVDLGDLEFRYWIGKTSESDYFDNDSANDDNLFTGLSLSYELPFLDGLSVGFNRTMLSKWKDRNSYTLFNLLVPFMTNKAGHDYSDQRASLFLDYNIPKGGIDLYFEWGKNDYNTHLDNVIRYPFHTQAITAGFKKTMTLNKKAEVYGQLLCEFTFIESSMDYHFFYDWGGSGNDFYSHGRILQGYTNKGQYIGAGIGAGGNAQTLCYKVFYNKGNTGITLSRINPDLNYSYFIDERDPLSSSPNDDVKSAIRVFLNIEISSLYYITNNLQLSGAFIFSDEHNPLNKNDNIYRTSKFWESEHRYNFVTQLGIKYFF